MKCKTNLFNRTTLLQLGDEKIAFREKERDEECVFEAFRKTGTLFGVGEGMVEIILLFFLKGKKSSQSAET